MTLWFTALGAFQLNGSDSWGESFLLVSSGFLFKTSSMEGFGVEGPGYHGILGKHVRKMERHAAGFKSAVKLARKVVHELGRDFELPQRLHVALWYTNEP